MAKSSSDSKIAPGGFSDVDGSFSPFRTKLKSEVISTYLQSPDKWWKEFLTDASYGASKKSPSSKIRVLDLFSSVGGLSLGASVAANLLGK